MPQGRDIGEAGEKSVTLVGVTSDGQVTLEERTTSCVEFQRIECSLEAIDDWRDAVATATSLLRAASQQPSDHVVVRLRLVGQTPIAWQMRRDLDLFVEQVSGAARALGTVGIEKVENHLEHPQAEQIGDDARHELASIMTDIQSEQSFTARVSQDVEDLVANLPPEIRNAFGDTDEERQAVVDALISEGIEEVKARMMAQPAPEV
jgi:hypothetical protein